MIWSAIRRSTHRDDQRKIGHWRRSTYVILGVDHYLILRKLSHALPISVDASSGENERNGLPAIEVAKLQVSQGYFKLLAATSTYSCNSPSVLRHQRSGVPTGKLPAAFQSLPTEEGELSEHREYARLCRVLCRDPCPMATRPRWRLASSSA